MKHYLVAAVALLFISSGFLIKDNDSIDDKLAHLLNDNKFDGKIQGELEKELRRKLNPAKINLGKLIFFAKGLQLHHHNSALGVMRLILKIYQSK